MPVSADRANSIGDVDDEWTMIVSPLALDAWRLALTDWRAANDPAGALLDDDLRVDVMRTTERDRVRVMARSEAIAALAPSLDL